MDDLANVGSNPAESTAAPETTQASVPSTRDALSSAFDKVMGGGERETAEARAERARDEAGRFAKAEAQAEATGEAAKVTQPKYQPPSRWTKEAVEAWGTIPEHVQAEVNRLEAELTKGLSEYQQRWEPLKQFHEMAERSGTTLDQALSSYIGIEQMLRQDPAAGFRAIAQNMGLDPAQVALMLAGAQPQQEAPEVAALKEHIRRLEQQVSGVTQTFQSQREAQVRSEVEKFAADKPHFDAVADDIAMLIQAGVKDLSEAYDRAVWANPTVRQKLLEEQTAKAAEAKAAQTRKATLSITGSPGNGSNPIAKAPPSSSTQAVKDAFASLGM